MEVDTLISDEALIQCYYQGKIDGLEHLFKKHRRKLYYYVKGKVNDDHLADDIVQDTYVKIFNVFQNKKYKEQGKFVCWMYKISDNLINDYYRSQNKKSFRLISAGNFSTASLFVDKSLNAEDAMIFEQFKHKMIFLIDKLSHEQKQVVIYRIYQNLSFKQIAELTSSNINTVLGRMRYALMNLRRDLFKKKTN